MKFIVLYLFFSSLYLFAIEESGEINKGSEKSWNRDEATDMISTDSNNHTDNNSAVFTVKETNLPPVVTEALPAPGDFVMSGSGAQQFYVEGYDPEGESFGFFWRVDGGEVVSYSDNYFFGTDHYPAGSYALTCELNDIDGASTIVTWNITVNDQEIVVYALAPDPGDFSINETGTVYFFFSGSDPDGQPLEHSWKIDGVEVSDEASYNYVTDLSSAGTYLATLDVTDNYGTKNSLHYEWNLVINDVDEAIVVDAIYPTPGDVTINENETINFSIDAEDPNGELSYSWLLDNVQKSTLSTYDFITGYTTAGTYHVSLDVTDNFGDKNREKSTNHYEWNITVANVNREPSIVSQIPVESNVTIESDGSLISFSIVADDEDIYDQLNYSWYIDDVDQNIDDVNFESPFAEGSYTVKVMVTDGIATAFTSWHVISSLAIEELIPQATKLYQNYPNPFNPETTITFDLAVNNEINISIYNMDGSLVKELVNGYQNAGTVKTVWDGFDNKGSQVSAGVYLYKMSTGSGYNTVKRAVMVK